MNMLQRKRDYNLDLLRIIAMLMIVCLHITGKGGLAALADTYLQNEAGGVFPVCVILIRVSCLISVNVFVLISGYYLCSSEFKPSRLIKLWLQVFLYSAGICLVLKLTGLTSIRIEDLFKSLLPVSYQQYWFVTCYFAMVLLSPVMNALVSAITQKHHKFFIVLIVILFSLWRDVTPLVSTLNISGTHFVWFLALYLIAAYIRKYGISGALNNGLVYFLIAVVLTGVHVCVDLILGIKPELSGYLDPAYFEDYISTPVLIASISFFLFFRNMKITPKCGNNLVGLLSPLTFGVYLIHDNPHLKELIWWEIFKTDAWQIDVFTVPKLLATVAIVFFCCCIIDFVRKLAFDKLLNSKIYINIAKKVDVLCKKRFQ